MANDRNNRGKNKADAAGKSGASAGSGPPRGESRGGNPPGNPPAGGNRPQPGGGKAGSATDGAPVPQPTEPTDVVDGIPGRSPNPRPWKYILLAVIFVAWVVFLLLANYFGSLRR